VSRDDLVLGDDDGVLFLPSPQAEEIFTLAETIRDAERRQAERIRAGASRRSPRRPCQAREHALPEFPRASAHGGRGHSRMTSGRSSPDGNRL
jgi:hypothetical protein